MSKIEITQVKSEIGGNQKQRDTLRSLGLGKIGRTVEREDEPVTMGMVNVVSHLVKVEEAK